VPLSFETRTGIATPPLQVWGLLVDTKTWKSWWPAVRDARTYDFKPLHDASRFEVTLQFARLRVTLVPQVVLAGEGKTLAWQTRWAGVPLRQEWFLDAKPEGCRATARLRFDGPGAAVLRWLRLGRGWETMLHEQVRGLKRVAERL
jgi:uncharacterized protein YndB with AHSA1/START domain